MSTMKHSTDESVVKLKMRTTFQYRQKVIHDLDSSCSVFDVFPRFLDIPGLVSKSYLSICLVHVDFCN